MLIVILIYVCYRYLTVLVPAQPKVLALIALLLTVLYVVGNVGAAALR